MTLPDRRKSAPRDKSRRLVSEHNSGTDVGHRTSVFSHDIRGMRDELFASYFEARSWTRLPLQLFSPHRTVPCVVARHPCAETAARRSHNHGVSHRHLFFAISYWPVVSNPYLRVSMCRAQCSRRLNVRPHSEHCS